MDNISTKKSIQFHVAELRTSTGSWPRYLVMTSMDGEKTLSKLSPFAIHKGIAGGEVTIKTSVSW